LVIAPGRQLVVLQSFREAFVDNTGQLLTDGISSVTRGVQLAVDKDWKYLALVLVVLSQFVADSLFD
jgi:hypothetical protein